MSTGSSKFTVTILGSNSALPANGRNPTAQLLNANHHYYLIDCGEGTQLQFRRFGLKMQRIKAVFISHMHGDHYFGLVGLLNSLQLLGRQMPLTIVAPPELEGIINLQMKAGGGKLQYPIQYRALKLEAQCTLDVYEDEQLLVKAFPLKHRIACAGFLFMEQKKDRTYLPEKGAELGIRVEDIPKLKKGFAITKQDGTVISCEQVTASPPPQRSYAYCTDTLPLESTAEFVRGANCLYHEATFLEAHVKRSKETYHSTAKEAGRIASKAQVRQLIIGHYSARYDSLEEHLAECQSVFPNTELALDGKEFEII